VRAIATYALYSIAEQEGKLYTEFMLSVSRMQPVIVANICYKNITNIYRRTGYIR
jgi:hypothetical protein